MTATGKEDLSDVVASVEQGAGTPDQEAKKREAAAAFEAFAMAQEAKRRKPRRRLPPGVLSVGAILLMVLAVWALSLQVQAPSPAVQPGGVHAPPPAGAFTPTVQVAGAGVEVAWPSVEGADQYVVVVLGEDLAELHRTAPGPATRTTLASGILPTPPLGGFVQVVALIMDVELETSPLVALPINR